MNNNFKIYYLIPDLYRKDFSILTLFRNLKRRKLLSYLKKEVLKTHGPVGGIKVIFQHVMILKKLGYNVELVRLGKYEGNFFNYCINTCSFKSIASSITENCVVVIPEYCPGYRHDFDKCHKVLFAQSINGVYGGLTHSYFDLEKNFIENGFVKIIACSDYVASKMQEDQLDKISIINNFLDHKRFCYTSDKRIEKRVLVLPRKNIKDINKIINLSEKLEYNFVFANHLSESELIDEYHKADIFIATGYPEGFGLPPLEAMACGAVVIGFTGGGAKEFMIHEKTALVAKDGDVETVVEYLIELLNNNYLKERIRKGGVKISSKYIEKVTADKLDTFFKKLSKEMK